MLTRFFKVFNRAVITLCAMKAHVCTIQNVIALPFTASVPLWDEVIHPVTVADYWGSTPPVTEPLPVEHLRLCQCAFEKGPNK
jgi:hypothetical protein